MSSSSPCGHCDSPSQSWLIGIHTVPSWRQSISVSWSHVAIVDCTCSVDPAEGLGTVGFTTSKDKYEYTVYNKIPSECNPNPIPNPNAGGLVCYSRSRSKWLKMVPCESLGTLFAFHSNYDPLFNVSQRDIGRKSQIFHPLLHSTLPLGGPRRNIFTQFGMGKPEWCGYSTVQKVWWYV